ncbi:MAG: ABC transporter permease [Bacteroidetes bacterium]|nr:MAG: ABC transporter permease [Bacteroidota bacterium]TAG89773.1 MAG: ABC transporter permease [Bacteroidota bacterium]
MNISLFIAQRFSKHQQFSFSKIVTRIAVASIALGLATILISFGILRGFEQNIKDKLFALSGHIFVEHGNTSNSKEHSFAHLPLTKDTKLYKNFKKTSTLSHLQCIAYKAGILKTSAEVLGVNLKGIGKDFDKNRFLPYIIKGKMIDFEVENESPQIIISKKIADQLELKVKDSVQMFFIQDPPRFRKFAIVGIFQTGLEEFDEKIIIGDLRVVQHLYQWSADEVGGYEIFVKNYSSKDSVSMKEVLELGNYQMQPTSVEERFKPIFEWLGLMEQNVSIFLSLILIVAGFGMISILLIMIMERVQTIGLLKALGATDSQVQKIFIYQGLYLVMRGMVWGNSIGLGLCALQYFTKIMPLDAENYYMAAVPIAWDWWAIFGVNFLIFVLIAVILLLPTWIITKIRPIQALRFD